MRRPSTSSQVCSMWVCNIAFFLCDYYYLVSFHFVPPAAAQNERKKDFARTPRAPAGRLRPPAPLIKTSISRGHLALRHGDYVPLHPCFMSTCPVACRVCIIFDMQSSQWLKEHA